MRRAGKLTRMNVGVTISAFGKRNFVSSGRTGGHMTFGAGHLRMATLQRIRGTRVGLNVERGRLPAVDRVAGRAFAFVAARGKLSAVRVLVAVGAFRECQRAFEITADVALEAIHFSVFTQQRELCARVIEFVLRQQLFPSRCCVTRLA